MQVAILVVVTLVCVLAVMWIFNGPAAGTEAVGNANVVGGVVGVLALLVAIAALWRQATPRRVAAAPVTAAQTQAATDYLARETLRYWRLQAKDRRITTPSPVAVRWGWGSEEVAVPAPDLDHGADVLTAGVVTQLREQLYDRLGDDRARVVVLGGPGAGKTAAMLLLVIDILKSWPEGSREPVPVWLTLGGWNPDTTSLLGWATATITRDYPGLAATEHGGPDAAAALLRTGRVALFLDGLDEMPSAVQGTALQAIDRDAAGLRVVLTSRPQQYRDALAQGQLYGAAVIDLLPIGVEQAQAFLLAEQLGDRRNAWQPVIDHLRAYPDSTAAQALTTPLALSLARDTYATSGDPAALLDTHAYPTPDALLRHLLARSLILAYPDPIQRQYATRWLSTIAQHMGTDRDLRWWDIPTWIPRWQRRLAFGLMGGLGLGLGLMGGLVSGLIVWLIVGLIVGFVVKLTDEPQLLTVRWPVGRELRNLLVGELRPGFLFGLGLGLMFLVVGLIEDSELRAMLWPLGRELSDLLAIGLVLGFFGLGFGLVWVLINVLVDVPLKVWSAPLATVRAAGPLEVHRADRRRSLVVGLMVGLTFGLIAGLVIGLTGEFTGGIMGGITVWLTVGSVVGGVGPALQLAMVETIWRLRFQRVRFLPLLQTALDRQVLRQAGAVYQFRHAALQDHLATREATSLPSIIDVRTPSGPTRVST